MSNWTICNGHFPVKFKIIEFTGFVYKITCNVTGMYYIGQKKFWRDLKLKPLKGKTRKRHVRKESDWEKYYGSSEQLKNDIKEFGKDAFTRDIIHLCKTKSEMNYMETLEQFNHHVLFDPKSYNKIINCRINHNMCNGFKYRFKHLFNKKAVIAKINLVDYPFPSSLGKNI